MQIITLGFEIWTKEVTCPVCNSHLRIDKTDIHRHPGLSTSPPADYYVVCYPCRQYRRATTLIPLANDELPQQVQTAALVNDVEFL